VCLPGGIVGEAGKAGGGGLWAGVEEVIWDEEDGAGWKKWEVV